MTSEARALLEKWNMDIRAEALSGELSAGTRQLLEIMKALSRRAEPC